MNQVAPCDHAVHSSGTSPRTAASSKATAWRSARGGARDRAAAAVGPSRIPATGSCPGAVLVARLPLTRPSQVPVAGTGDVPRDMSPVLDIVGKGGGQPLDRRTRTDMEARFGSDFAHVRIHTGDKAALSATAVSAKAYTVGNEVVFGHGSFDPVSFEGRHRLAHELAHVEQQRQGLLPGTGGGKGVVVSDPSDAFERQAEATATRVVSGADQASRGDLHQDHRRGSSLAGIRSVQRSSGVLLQRDPDPKEQEGSNVPASPYPEEQGVIAYAVGARKLNKFAEGAVLTATKDWTAAVLTADAFYVGPFLSDMGTFYYVYRFTKADQGANTYTLTRGTYLPARNERNLPASLAQVHGKTTLQVSTPGTSPPPSTSAAGNDPKAAPGTASAPGNPSNVSGTPSQAAPAPAAAILPEFADKSVEQCREIVGDIYGGLNKEANSGILDHKLDAVNGMQTILDKTDPAVSSNAIFFLSLVTNALAGALGAGLPTIAFNAIVWGAAGAANGAVAFFSNDNLIDAVQFCQDYTQSLRMSKDKVVEQVRSQIVGDLAQVRAAASAFRRMQQDPQRISFIKLNQEQEVLDLWTNMMLAEKERRKNRKIGDKDDPGKIGSADYGSATEGRVLLAAGRLEANWPYPENPFRWTRSPDTVTMPGVPDRARQKNLNRKIQDMPVVRTMRVSTSLTTMWFTVAMSADGTETAQPFHSDPDLMEWVLASFLLDRPVRPGSDDIKANWRLGITKCWDQVRNKTFAELGISSIIGDKGVYGE